MKYFLNIPVKNFLKQPQETNTQIDSFASSNNHFLFIISVCLLRLCSHLTSIRDNFLWNGIKFNCLTHCSASIVQLNPSIFACYFFNPSIAEIILLVFCKKTTKNAKNFCFQKKFQAKEIKKEIFNLIPFVLCIFSDGGV